MRTSAHRLRLLVPLAFFAAAFSSAAQVDLPQLQGAEPRLAAGVARVDITPEYAVRLNGFGFRRNESEGVRQRIWARALAIGDDACEGGPAVFIAIDTLAAPDWLVGEVARRLKPLGVRREKLSLAATHTHSAPMINGVSPTIFSQPIPPEHQQRIDRYSQELADKLEQAARAALKNRVPCSLGFTRGVVGFAQNRRAQGGPVDHDLPLLAVRDGQGELKAVLVTYACHCVTLSDNLISGDWAGYACEEIERRFPGATALVSIGCGADANPSSGVTGDKAEVARAQGVEIATEVARLLAGPLAPLPPPKAQLDFVDLPLAPLPTRDEWEARAKDQGTVGHHARTQLARLDSGEELPAKIRYPVQSWTFGETLAMVFLPGEVVVDYSVRLKRELDGNRLWIHAYSNGAPGYVPSERILREGGYEGGGAMLYYGIPGPYAPGLEDIIVGQVRKQLRASFPPPVDPAKTQGSLPKTPQQSLAAMHALPGYRVELAAAEPLVASPVAVDFGPDGKLWVAEMYDYPAGIANDYQPGGRIRLLEDADGDGRFDTAKVFLENLPFPTGVTVWRDGVLVCAAPDILFARDLNGDGRADEVKKLYSGFGTENFQARVNSLRYGLDGWVYGSCGLFGGTIQSFNGKSLALGNRDFRIRPDTGEIEPVTGTTQQGRVRNDWGDWFGCDNSTLIRHYPLADHYLRRNPHVAPPATAVSVASGPDPGRLFPLSKATLFPLSGPPNRVTAACGLEIYRDDLLGPEFQGDSFTCEPVSNLVRHLRLKANGVTFAGTRPEEDQREFLASRDPWFRPVQARTGPDGALWVVDMYRYVIEHPRWIPPAMVAQLDVRAGHNLGRIYRVVPAAPLANSDRLNWPRQRLDHLDAAALVSALDSANGWQRDMAQQLLLWRGEKSAAKALQRLLRECQRPEARLHALCTLALLDGDGQAGGLLDAPTLIEALSDNHPGVRRHAVRLAEQLAWNTPGLAERLAALARDDDKQVVLQVACSLGAWAEKGAAELLGNLLGEQEDAYVRAALMSSVRRENLRPVLARLLRAPRSKASMRAAQGLAALCGAVGSRDDVELLAQWLASSKADDGEFANETFAACAVLLETLPRRGENEAPAALVKLLASARDVAADARAAESRRMAAVDVLGRWPSARDDDARALARLLGPQSPAGLQLAAAQALDRADPQRAPARLLEAWPALTPPLRAAVLDILLSRRGGVEALLWAVEERHVLPADLDAARRQRLVQTQDAALRARAEKALSLPPSQDRRKVLAEYQDVLSLPGDSARGKLVFAKRCAACHALEGVGRAVGQDLAALTNRSPEALLIAVLDPNRQLDQRFVTYTALTRDGRTFSGMLANETSTSITLKGQDGQETSLLRSEIEQLQSNGKSLMPEGLERDISRQELADLFAYIGQLAPPYKQFAGNAPQLVRPAEDGSLALLASMAEIRGGDIQFELPFGNIGYWHGAEDHAVWTLLPGEGQYDVWLDFACHPDSAGNAFVLEGGEPPLRGKIPSTGGWDQYRQQKFGTVRLKREATRIAMRPDGPLARGALVDLRAIVLVPAGATPKFPWAAADARMPADVDDPRHSSPADYARRILDESVPQAERIAIIQSQPQLAPELIAALADGLAHGTAEASREEYRRIPWLWRVAVAAGKRNDAMQIRQILQLALPAEDEPLRDWQAVVIGGGIVNGVSQTGAWPRTRVQEIIADDKKLAKRWEKLLDQAATMAENERIAVGTRYDALRILGCDTWERRGQQLCKYLVKGTNDELQMGAISGLADIQHAAVAGALLAGMQHYSQHNQNLALDALLRERARTRVLLDAVAAGKISVQQLGTERVTRLLNHEDEEIRELSAIHIK